MKFTGEWFAIALFALPWLNPFAPGPSPAVLPWLASATCGAIGLVVILLGTERKEPELAARSWVIAGLVSAVIGLVQYFGVSDELLPWVNATSMGAASANLRQRNQFASLMNIGLVALLCWSMRYKAMPSGAVGFYAIGQSAAPGLLMVGNAASSSRTGLLELFAVVLIAVYWGALRNKAASRMIVTALIAYGAASISLPWLAGLGPGSASIFARLQDGGPACASRLTLWSNVLHLITLKPWFGWGWGELDFAHFITLYPGPRFCEIADNAHNLPLHLAVELGVPFALLACGFMAWLVWRSKLWRERDGGRQMAWGVLAVIGIHSLLEYPLWYGPFQIAVGLCVWIFWTTSADISGKPPTSTKVRPGPIDEAIPVSAGMRWGLSFLAAAVLVAAGCAAWDYHRISQIYLPPAQRMAEYRTNTLEKIRDTWFFQNQVKFAELSTTPLTADNAAFMNSLAHQLLSFSPEARVVVKLIDSARILGRDEEAAFFEVRFKAAYPEAFQQWLAQPNLGGSGPRHKVP